MIQVLKKIFKKKPQVIIICGPTATGKTSLSVSLAKEHGGEIISADSRQIYKGLDIGSAKITPKEMEGIPHHMIDIVDPISIFSVAEYAQQAELIITDIISRKKIPIICGGTGMYIDALVYGINFPKVPPNYELRNKLEQYSCDELYALLREKDIKRAQTIDPYNKVRLVRALEVIDSLGTVPNIRQKSKKYQTLFIGLDSEKNIHRDIISKRIVNRFEHKHMLQEAIDLYTNGLSYERMESLGLEYRYMARHLQHQISYENMVDEITKKTIQFAKRQRTWFKRNKKIHWFNSIGDLQKIKNLVRTFLRKK